jgi:hypothetical protein
MEGQSQSERSSESIAPRSELESRPVRSGALLPNPGSPAKAAEKKPGLY